ncbi:unnamed protein product [Owenia fusiformis]|uniref:Phospholipid scramblase n=1 Tax=Owenia fusiformis TaxID=6347 RepID=A0A8J1Y103_OWEFU|nr:unnamed protein product [Owenia fusiformis]CAH1781339.1 unnamed protein product [Owenia fusiformis]
MSVVTVQPSKGRGGSASERIPLEERNGSNSSQPSIVVDDYDDDSDDDIPKGMEALEDVANLIITQDMARDIKAGCCSGLTYDIRGNDEDLYYATEDKNCFCRWTCGPARSFMMRIFDRRSDLEMMSLKRAACRCDWWCCLDKCCCQHSIIIQNYNKETMGFIRQKFHIFGAKLDVLNRNREVKFKIKGPCCPCRCCQELIFDIYDKEGEKCMGYILKTWQGYNPETNMDHENFEVRFPMGISAKDKALLLGAAYLVNFMYFEMS